MNNLSRARTASERPRASASAVQDRPAGRAGGAKQVRRQKEDGAKASKTVLELSDSISGEVARSAERAVEQAELLESIGEKSFDLAGEIFSDSNADGLRRRSHLLRGLVVHSLVVLAELQCIAGRLDALAAMREAEHANDKFDET